MYMYNYIHTYYIHEYTHIYTHMHTRTHAHAHRHMSVCVLTAMACINSREALISITNSWERCAAEFEIEESLDVCHYMSHG